MLEIVGLTVDDDADVPIVEDIDMSVGAGEFYVLVGSPGAGKSVVLDMLLGWRVPQRGHVRVAGEDVRRDPRRARSLITYIPGTGVLLPTQSVRRNVQLFLELAGVRGCPRNFVDRALRDAEIPDRHFTAPAHSIPPGDRVSVWLAIAALRHSAAILLDDPGRDLGGNAPHRLAEQLDRLRSRGVSVLATSRDATFGASVAHRVGVLDGGRKVAEYEYSNETLPSIHALAGSGAAKTARGVPAR